MDGVVIRSLNDISVSSFVADQQVKATFFLFFFSFSLELHKCLGLPVYCTSHELTFGTASLTAVVMSKTKLAMPVQKLTRRG